MKVWRPAKTHTHAGYRGKDRRTCLATPLCGEGKVAPAWSSSLDKHRAGKHQPWPFHPPSLPLLCQSCPPPWLSHRVLHCPRPALSSQTHPLDFSYSSVSSRKLALPQVLALSLVKIQRPEPLGFKGLEPIFNSAFIGWKHLINIPVPY